MEDRILLLNNDYEPVVYVDVTPGLSWHIADFTDYVVFANGVEVYTFDKRDGFGECEALPRFSTCCTFNGQLIGGGIIGDNFSKVVWSKIGEARFSQDMMNDSGSAILLGEVLSVRKLSGDVAVYTTQGVWRLRAVQEPVPGFGLLRETEIPGLASRSAVCGTDDTHVMIDSTGRLWQLTFGQPAKLLGFEEFLAPMLGHEIIATYRQDEQAFYFTDGELSFRWDGQGLSRTWQAVTSQWLDFGIPLAYFHDVDNKGFELISDVMDFGFRGKKTITGIEVGGSFDKPVFASVDWRAHNEKYFRSIPWKRVNPDGFVNMPVTAEEFRIKLMSQSTQAELDYALVKYQITDRRNLRGQTRVDSNNSGTD